MRLMAKGFVVLLVLTLCAPLGAQDFSQSGLKDRVSVSLGAFWPQLSTNIRLDAFDGTVGTDLSLEDDLGLSDREATPSLRANWRIKGPHHLELGWFRLNREGQRVLEGEIRIEDEVFLIDETLQSKLDSQIFYLYYGYDFFHKKERSMFGVMGGLHTVKIDASFRVLDREVEESADATAPLPLFGLFGGYAFNPKWGFYGQGQVFALKFDDYEGSLYNIWLEIHHNPFKQFGWGFGYNWFEFNLDATADDLTGNLDFIYQGPQVFVKWRLPSKS